MSTFEINPDRSPDGRSPFRITIGHDQNYGTALPDGGYEFMGDALVTPPVHVSEEYLETLEFDNEVQLKHWYSTDEGTLLRFRHTSDSFQQGDEEIKDMFQSLLKDLGKTSLLNFKEDWDRF